MQVIGQDADGKCFERPSARDLAIGGTQVCDLIGQQVRAPVLQGDGEKIGATRHIETSIIWHGPIVASLCDDAILGDINRRAKRPGWPMLQEFWDGALRYA